MTRRNAVTLVVVFIALCALVFVSVVDSQRTADADVPYAPESSQYNGTLALFEWIKAIGCKAEHRGVLTGDLPDTNASVLVLPSPQTRDQAWADELVQWAHDGGTLIVVHGDDSDAPLLRALEVDVQTEYADVNKLRVEHALPDAADAPTIALGGRESLSTSREHIAHITSDGAPLLISMKEGNGTIYITTLSGLFTNDGMRNENNARWVRAMIGRLPSGSWVVFDQTRVAVDFAEQPSFNKLLFSTPWGWGLMFMAAVLAGYIILNGRRFGRVVLPRAEALAVEGLGMRRDPAEYVVSTAGLFERAGRRSMVLRHTHQRVKRVLGRRWQINPTLPDEAFVDALRRSRDDIDRDATLQLLQSLDPERAGAINDRDLLARARAAEKFIADNAQS